MYCRIPPSSGLLRGVRWFKTDVSGLPNCPISTGEAAADAWNHACVLSAVCTCLGSLQNPTSNCMANFVLLFYCTH